MLREIDRLLKGRPRGIRWESVIRDRIDRLSESDYDELPPSDYEYDEEYPYSGMLTTVLMAVGSVIGLVLSLGVVLTIYTLADQPAPTPTPQPAIAFSDIPVRPVEALPTLRPSASPTVLTQTAQPSATATPTDTPFPSQTLPAADTWTPGPTFTFTPAPTLTPGVVFTLGMIFPQTPGGGSSSALPPDPILFVRDGQLWVIGSQGSGLTALLPASGRIQEPTWSGGRQQIAFSADVDGNLDIYVMDTATRDPVRITNDFAADTSPTWIGSRLIFASARAGAGDLYSVSSGGSDLRPLTSDGAVDRDPAASLDGARIVFASNRDGGDFDLFLINADGGGLTQLTADDKDSGQPAWSPDGARIAYLNGGDIYLLDVASRDVEALTQLGSVSGMSWSQDGSRIVFGAGGDLWIVSVTGGIPLPLTAGPERDSDPAWSR